MKAVASYSSLYVMKRRSNLAHEESCEGEQTLQKEGVGGPAPTVLN